MGNNRVTIFVPGTPQPQGNHRVGRAGHIYDSNPKLEGWRRAVTLVARRAWLPRKPLDEPACVAIEFKMPRPKRPRFTHPAVKPDLDKLERAIGDALEAAGVLKNDSRIVHVTKEKVYAAPGELPGATITIAPLAEKDGDHHARS